MNTKDKIIHIGDQLIRTNGYNAFSFSDISKELNIKNASIHYHFPTKALLVISIIQKHLLLLEKFKKAVAYDSPIQKIIKFLLVYSAGRANGKTSILGALTSDYNTFESQVQTELKLLMENTLHWLTETLKEGKTTGAFLYEVEDRTKALLIITNILGAEQLSKITFNHDFQEIKETIIANLIKK